MTAYNFVIKSTETIVAFYMFTFSMDNACNIKVEFFIKYLRKPLNYLTSYQMTFYYLLYSMLSVPERSYVYTVSCLLFFKMTFNSLSSFFVLILLFIHKNSLSSLLIDFTCSSCRLTMFAKFYEYRIQRSM